MQIPVLELCGAGEVEAADVQVAIALQGRSRVDAGATCCNSIDMEAGRGSRGLEIGEPLLAERFHRALVLTLRGVELALALDNHRDVGGPVAARLTPRGGGNAEPESQPPALCIGRAAEAHAQATAIRPCATFAKKLCAPPVDIGIDRSAHPGAQVPALTGQAADGRWRG